MGSLLFWWFLDKEKTMRKKMCLNLISSFHTGPHWRHRSTVYCNSFRLHKNNKSTLWWPKRRDVVVFISLVFL